MKRQGSEKKDSCLLIFYVHPLHSSSCFELVLIEKTTETIVCYIFFLYFCTPIKTNFVQKKKKLKL